MKREHLVRDDFPSAHGVNGFDADSVGAHLAAVAAHVAALEARITALEVERDTLRTQLADARAHEEGPSGLPEPGPDPLENLPAAPESEPQRESEPVAEPAPDPVVGDAPDQDASPVAGGEEVAARLLATKLAMEGKSRDTIVMQLAAEHEIADPGTLVDDVIARLA
jgi:cell division septum initiation protein DivIVA